MGLLGSLGREPSNSSISGKSDAVETLRRGSLLMSGLSTPIGGTRPPLPFLTPTPLPFVPFAPSARSHFAARDWFFD